MYQNESASVKCVSKLTLVVGRGPWVGSTVRVSGRKAIPKRISLGVAFNAGMMRSFRERTASSRCLGQFQGIDLGPTSPGVLSKSGEQSRFSLFRIKLLALSTRPFTHGAYAAVAMCVMSFSLQKELTWWFLKWEPPSVMKVVGVA